MDLTELGLDDIIREGLDSEMLKEHQLARVAAVDRESFVVYGESTECRAEPSGKMMYASVSPLDYPTVGDWVYVQYFDGNGFAVIHGLVPRKSLFKRKAPGRATEVQLIAANIDTALIVQSLDADFSPERLERYVVLALESGIEPVALLSKSDLASAEEVSARLMEIQKRLPDIKAISFSNLAIEGMSVIRDLLTSGRTYCLLGSSGVGKTTLLNNLLGEEAFKTLPVREGDHKGRHSTTRRQLSVLQGGAIIIDTPGMRELGAFDVGTGIEETFGAIAQITEGCRFSDCTHMHEKGCAVLAALERGEIDPGQYDNYIKMVREATHYSLSYSEKRRKDKDFGKMVKSVKKTLGKKNR